MRPCNANLVRHIVLRSANAGPAQWHACGGGSVEHSALAQNTSLHSTQMITDWGTAFFWHSCARLCHIVELEACVSARAVSSWWACLQVPLVASNRIGEEKMDSGSITFYGGSFIAGPTGEIREQVSTSSSLPSKTTFARLCVLILSSCNPSSGHASCI